MIEMCPWSLYGFKGIYRFGGAMKLRRELDRPAEPIINSLM
jgi:hypothetical protein